MTLLGLLELNGTLRYSCSDPLPPSDPLAAQAQPVEPPLAFYGGSICTYAGLRLVWGSGAHMTLAEAA